MLLCQVFVLDQITCFNVRSFLQLRVVYQYSLLTDVACHGVLVPHLPYRHRHIYRTYDTFRTQPYFPSERYLSHGTGTYLPGTGKKRIDYSYLREKPFLDASLRPWPPLSVYVVHLSP